VLDVVKENDTYMEAHPGENIPRYLGMHSFRTGEGRGQRVISSFSQWMFQRAWDHYHSLTAGERSGADELLNRVGGREAFDAPLQRHVQRVKGQLELVAAS
jgi:hypothetical protein